MATPSKMSGSAAISATLTDVDDTWESLDTDLAAVTTFLNENREDKACRVLKRSRKALDGRMMHFKGIISKAAEEAADCYKRLACEKSKVCKAQAKVKELESKLAEVEKKQTIEADQNQEDMKAKIKKLEAEVQEKNVSLSQFMTMDDKAAEESELRNIQDEGDGDADVEVIKDTQQ